MKIKRFEDINPNHRIAVHMVYYHACRVLRRLEHQIKINNLPEQAKRQLILTAHIQHKLEQMIAKWKSL